MDPVVVAHGLWMPGPETIVLRRRLAAAGFAPRLFRFPTVTGTLAQNAARLAEFCESIPGDRLHYVGFSLGGVVAVEMLMRYAPPRPGHVVCLAAPLNGSHAAERLARFWLGRRIVGHGLMELNARGGLGRWPGDRPLGAVAGSRSFGSGSLLGGLPRPSDGTVSVAETRMPGLSDHVVLPVTHTSIMFSREAAALTARFLANGRFGA